MKMTRKLTAALLGAVLMVSATAASAQRLPPEPHFAFTVPLRLVNLPPGDLTYRVVCMVYDAGGDQMARGIKQADFSGGAVDTEVVVNVSVRVDGYIAPPSEATSYECLLVLFAGGSQLLYEDHTVNPVNLALSFGAPFIPVVSGSIPR
ncbi:MAG: hypothetical protein WC213_07635 [Arenimonas sp.]|jgi:hypothetical protein